MNPFDIAAPAKPTGQPGCYADLSNDAYHNGPGVSKSQLDLIHKSPSLLPWSKAAPVHKDKLAALDFGTALHTLILEPHLFSSQFRIGPVVNRRTTAGREQEAEFLAQCESDGAESITADEHAKLLIMRDSLYAHPTARYLMELDGGVSESSIYWNDEQTGELCRCRPDRMIQNRNIIVDLKSTADISKIPKSAEEFRYHVQQAMYCAGYKAHFGEIPEFWFLFASSTVSAGRYEIGVIRLDNDWVVAGEHQYRQDLETYHQCVKNDDCIHIETINRPFWASRK